MMKVAVIIPAAGSGRRFGQVARTGTKLELDLGGKPVFLWSVEMFLQRDEVHQVLLAVNPESIEEFRFRWGDKMGFLGAQLIPGGTLERWETVSKALDAVDNQCTHVAVHDAVRPLVSMDLVDRVFTAARTFEAVIPTISVSNTLKRVETVEESTETVPDPLDVIFGSSDKSTAARRVLETIDRTDLVEVQTPQVFTVNLLRRAYQMVADGKVRPQGITDDAGLVEALGEPVWVVEGEATNLKITHAADAELAGAILDKQQATKAKEIGEKRLFVDEE